MDNIETNSVEDNYKHIELFAGCGGMSLGLESAGFELYCANELSPMASETFAFNLLGEDLSDINKKRETPKNVIWIKSAYSLNEIDYRLRENPFEFFKGKISDLDDKTDLKGKLVVGSIIDFLEYLSKNKNVCNKIRKQNIDLLSGGPPCQGFSLAGKRVKEDYKNSLPLSFAEFAGIIQPKVVLLENVKGITSPFETKDGIKHYAWLEIAKTFSLQGYYPVCMLINSKYFGVPQNRPRFILYAFRKDVFQALKNRKDNTQLTTDILKNSLLFYDKVHKNRLELDKVNISDIQLYDIETTPDYFDGKFLPNLLNKESNFRNAKDAIGDITSTAKHYKIESLESEYSQYLSQSFKRKFDISIDDLRNHEPRSHSYKVRARFRLYQVLNNLNGLRQDAMGVISGKCQDNEVVQNVFSAIKNEPLLFRLSEKDIFKTPDNLNSFKKYLKEIGSKKHSQRAIRANEPAPAQMTIPDDLCHYSKGQLRTLTVREMARFQSFPDWFVFRSKITTGGKQRGFEVPQYTQVGNAVPPILALELGKTVIKLLKSLE